ncbi:MAG: hypothetical protein V2I54_07475 [Bacteroidales bacterium]|nr:hypothetical protein [Bacteroidales bacterium]
MVTTRASDACLPAGRVQRINPEYCAKQVSEAITWGEAEKFTALAKVCKLPLFRRGFK